MIGGVLGHRSESTIRRYADLQSDPLEHAPKRFCREIEVLLNAIGAGR
jgi:hypothetical protein